MNLSYCLLAVPVAIAVELFVVSGAWDALKRWWAKQNAMYVKGDDEYVITSLYEYKRERRP